ncbi:hypothetical protein ACTZIH_25975 (plasmid) [Escherichia coli]
MSGPQSMREALIAELIGDVDGLINRLEGLQSALPEAAEKSAAKVSAAGDSAVRNMTATGEKIRTDFIRDADSVLKALQKATGEAQAASRVVSGSAKRFAALALVVGLSAGIIGGVLAGMLAAYYFLGA